MPELLSKAEVKRRFGSPRSMGSTSPPSLRFDRSRQMIDNVYYDARYLRGVDSDGGIGSS